MRACQPSFQNLILLSGPRWSGKTLAALNTIAQHAWNTDRGNIVVLTLTQSVGLDSGVWIDLIETILPEWIDGNFGMEWVKKPYVQNVTKKPACSVLNKFGNESRIQLDSLKNEDEVEGRYKGKRYSMIFINELSKFKSRNTFDAMKQCLRMLHLREEDHLLLCDTNPSDEGTESWIYELWYEFRTARDVDASLLPLQKALKLIEYTVDDNFAMSPDKKASLMADFSHDEDLLARYFYGKWVTASADAIFHRVFRPAYHVVGEEETPTNTDPEMMFPEADCIELYTGWDPGGTNSAAVIMEKFFPRLPEYNGLPAFKVLDELAVIGEDVDLKEFVNAMLRKMDFWEGMVGKHVGWKHWSDRSVFDMKDLESHKYYVQLIHEMSDGRIRLEGAERSPGSVRAGVDLMRRLLWEDRLFLNRARCPICINAIKSVKRGKSELAVIQKGSPHKHPIDAMRYVLQSECYFELNKQVFMNVRKKRESAIVSVPY